MKRLLLILLYFPHFIFGQQTINDSIIHDNLYRSYITYIPTIYNPSQPTPLVFNFHGLNEPLVNYRVHEDNFSKRNTDIFYEEFLSWYKDQCKINDEDFKKNKKYFTKKLLFLEINHLLLNKKKNLLLFKKILQYPNILQMLKFIIGFMLPKKIIRLIKN